MCSSVMRRGSCRILGEDTFSRVPIDLARAGGAVERRDAMSNGVFDNVPKIIIRDRDESIGGIIETEVFVDVFDQATLYELTRFITISCRTYSQPIQSLESGICVCAGGWTEQPDPHGSWILQTDVRLSPMRLSIVNDAQNRLLMTNLHRGLSG